jgi:hypothetical protein
MTMHNIGRQCTTSAEAFLTHQQLGRNSSQEGEPAGHQPDRDGRTCTWYSMMLTHNKHGAAQVQANPLAHTHMSQ